MTARRWPLTLAYAGAAFVLGIVLSRVWLTPEPEVITETVTETEEVEVTPDACVEAVGGVGLWRGLLADAQQEADDALDATTEGDELDFDAYEQWIELGQQVDAYTETLDEALNDVEATCQ